MADRDDVGVYKLRDDLATVETIDFFTPIVDDPYDFGQIAVANALSDVYAKGGKPITALNVVCFPSGSMEISVLRDILRGGVDKLNEAHVVLLGGHSVMDPELKYGLSVTGIIHPDKVIAKLGAKLGDVLVLTKPLGIGIITTAMKAGYAEEEVIALATRQMAALNKRASELMIEAGVHACTDVTGFSLLGHASEMLRGANIGFVIESARVPLLPKVQEYARRGAIPGGVYRNKDFYSPYVETKLPDEIMLILYNPETSGGLLMALPEKSGEALVARMHQEGLKDAAIVGRAVSEPKGKISVV